MGEGREKDEAFVTLATNDTYALGCLVLGNSLRRVGTTRQLVVLVTQGVSPSMRNQLGGLFDHTFEVNVLDSSDTNNLELLGRPDLSVTFTKLHCWRLTQFKKCVFLDADILILQNIDELFDREELSAAPDPGWPDCFNSGVFVYVPSEETYRSLLTFAVTTGSFDGGDQGLLNLYFSNWATSDISRHLSFTYNVVSQAFYSYLPALKQFHDNIKVVHFIGPVKPWHHGYNTATRTVTALPNTNNNVEFLQIWWDIFMQSVQPNLDPSIYEAVYVRLTHDPPPPAPVIPETKQDYGHQLQRDHRGHGDIRTEPTTSYQVFYPYTPPDVDNSSQPSSEPTVPEDVSQSRIVDVPVVYREYKAFETHYSEEPLSAVNPELPPLDHYFASVEIRGPQFTFGEVDKGNINENSSQAHDSVSIEEIGKDSIKHNEIVAQTENLDARDVSVEEGAVSGLAENNMEDVGDHAADTDGRDENDNIPEKGGIVGDLASLTLEGDTSSTKSDLERRLQWEQGQADYMGVDRFDNIKARLDEKIAKPVLSETKSPVVEKQ